MRAALAKARGNGRTVPTPPDVTIDDEKAGKVAFYAYCVFIVSYFTHLGARVSALGAIRFDILVCGLALVLIVTRKKNPARPSQPLEGMQLTSKLLLVLCAYVIVTLPFVRWPGSVVGHGWEPFLKAILIYVLTVCTVTTEKRLKIFLAVFLSVQTFRVLEPLWMHITTGYWGSFTNMGNYELMDRLSGSPYDIVNPNGLAFIIIVVISLSHHVMSKGGFWPRMLYLGMLAPLLYALMLSASRSGMLAVALFALLVILRSKHRALALCALTIIIVGLIASMSDIQRQRYLSIVDHHAKGGASAEGRVDGLWVDFKVGLETPVFGHGLGTSLEANANAYGEALPSHTLYTEVLQELGFVGLFIFMAFIIEACKNCIKAVRATASRTGFVLHAGESARDFAFVLMFFSIASYGLNEYQWYLLAGLSVVLRRLSSKQQPVSETTQASVTGPAVPRRRARLPLVRHGRQGAR